MTARPPRTPPADVSRHPARLQPCCGKLVDAATIVTGPGEKEGKVAPVTGDFSMCIYCGAWLRFTDDFGACRKFDAEDILDLTDDQRELMRRGSAMIQALLKAGIPPPKGMPKPFVRHRRARR